MTTIIAFVVGFLAGRIGASYYHSKKECRECRKRMAECGFHVGYKEYECVEKVEAHK